MKTKLFILILALQSAWVIGTVAVQESKLHNGTVVLLETGRVDPRDLLRGDYVILNYKISSVPLSSFQPVMAGAPAAGTPIFVRLEKKGKFYSIASASLILPDTDASHPVLRGQVDTGWTGTGSVRVQYGLERYYVREGTGNPTGELTVAIAIPASGQATIKQVYLDGKPYAEVMKKVGR